MSDDEDEYTTEQKIVSAVWVHERSYNQQTWKDIHFNFLTRFSLPPPSRETLLKWERKLFRGECMKAKSKMITGRPLSRLMHVPYVRASLAEDPDLSLNKRSKVLGLPTATLLKIIKEDLNMEFEVNGDETSNLNKRHDPNGGGRWIKKEPIEPECS